MSATEIVASDRPGPPAPAEGARPARPAPASPRARRPRRLRTFTLAFLAVLLVLLPAGLAAVYSSMQPPTYAAVADILYEGDRSTSSDAIERQLATQQVLLTNRSAIDVTAGEVGRPADDLLDSVSVEVVEGSNVLRLRAEDGTRAGARAIAESLVTQYTAVVAQRAASQREQQQAVVDEQVAALTERLVAATTRIRQIAGNPSPALTAEQRQLEGEAQVVRQQLSALQSQALENSVDRLDGGGMRAEVLAPATVLDQPVAPLPLRAAAGGALVGLVLAFLLLVTARQRRTGPDAGAAVLRS